MLSKLQLPKGGKEENERLEGAALREAWEEVSRLFSFWIPLVCVTDLLICRLMSVKQGGILGWVEELIVRLSPRRALASSALVRLLELTPPLLYTLQCSIPTARTDVYFYALQVSSLAEEWPEDERAREWVSPEDALVRVGTFKFHLPRTLVDSG